MSDTLSPDVIAAINKVAATPLGRKFDRMARRKYGKSGVAVGAKQVIGESGGRRNAVSSAGAKGLTQFMPGTRDEVLKATGYDAYGSPKEAIQAMMYYDLQRGGIEGYNPGMPTYAQYILNQKLGSANSQLIRRPGRGAGGRAGAGSAASGTLTLPGPTNTTVTRPDVTIPGQSFEAERASLREGLFLGGGKLTMDKLLAYKQQANALQDIPDQTVPGQMQVDRTTGPDIKLRTKDPNAGPGVVQMGGGGKGAFSVQGNAKRLKPELSTYARKVARVYGGTMVGLDGATHSKMTVNGRVSEHFTGNATDVFTLNGKKYGQAGWERELIRAGRAALIAAGMPRAKAMQQTGGLYNVGNHQVIFNVDGVQNGGNHLDHLHISSHAR